MAEQLECPSKTSDSDESDDSSVPSRYSSEGDIPLPTYDAFSDSDDAVTGLMTSGTFNMAEQLQFPSKTSDSDESDDSSVPSRYSSEGDIPLPTYDAFSDSDDAVTGLMTSGCMLPSSNLSITEQRNIGRILSDEARQPFFGIFPAVIEGILTTEYAHIVQRLRELPDRDRTVIISAGSLLKIVDPSWEGRVPASLLCDVCVFSPTRPVLVLTFTATDGVNQKSIQYNTQLARLIIQHVKEDTKFDFNVVHETVDNIVCQEKHGFLTRIDQCENSAKSICFPTELHMDHDKCTAIIESFLNYLSGNTELTRRSPSREDKAGVKIISKQDEGPRSDMSHKEIARHHGLLKEELEVTLVLDKLYERGIFSIEDICECKAKLGTSAQSDELLTILTRKGKRGYHIFMQILSEVQPHLKDELQLREPSLQANSSVTGATVLQLKEQLSNLQMVKQIDELKDGLHKLEQSNIKLKHRVRQLEREGPRSDMSHKEILRRHHGLLKEELAKLGISAQSDELLTILTRKGKRGYDIFMQILSEVQPHLKDELQLREPSLQANSSVTGATVLQLKEQLSNLPMVKQIDELKDGLHKREQSNIKLKHRVRQLEREGPRSDMSHKEILRHHHGLLKEELAKLGISAQSDELLTILTRKGKRGYDIFMQILSEVQPHLKDELQLREPSLQANSSVTGATVLQLKEQLSNLPMVKQIDELKDGLHKREQSNIKLKHRVRQLEREGPRSDMSHKEILRRHHGLLKEELAKLGISAQSDELLTILTRKGKRGYDIFMQILSEVQPHLKDELQLREPSLQANSSVTGATVLQLKEQLSNLQMVKQIDELKDGLHKREQSNIKLKHRVRQLEREGPRSNMSHKEILRRHHGLLKEELEVTLVLDILYERGIFSIEDNVECKAKLCRSAQSDELLTILTRKGKRGYDIFMQILSEVQPHLKDELQLREPSLQANSSVTGATVLQLKEQLSNLQMVKQIDELKDGLHKREQSNIKLKHRVCQLERFQEQKEGGANGGRETHSDTGFSNGVTSHLLKSATTNNIFVLLCIHLKYDKDRVNLDRVHINTEGDLVNRESDTRPAGEGRLKKYWGTCSTAPLPRAGCPQYWEMKSRVSLDKPLTEGALILEVGVCREEQRDVSYYTGGEPSSCCMQVALCTTHGGICRETCKEGKGVLCLPDTLPNTAGASHTLHYGVVYDNARKKIVFIDVKENKVMSTLDNVDSSQPLWPMFGVYNPHLLTVSMALVVGSDINMTEEKKAIIAKALS